jgi:hypothetical protein
LRGKRERPQVHVRRLLAQAAQHAGDEGDLADVRRQDGETALGLARIELRLLQDLGVDRLHHAVHGGASSSARGVGSMREPVPHEQRVVEDRAQPRQRRAGGGLAQAHQLGRLVDAALPRHRVEDHQQVQVDVSNIHAVDFIYPRHPLDGWRTAFYDPCWRQDLSLPYQSLCGCGIDAHAHVIPENFPRYLGAAVPADWPSMAPAQPCHRNVMISGKVYRTVSDKCWDTGKRLADFAEMGLGAAGRCRRCRSCCRTG